MFSIWINRILISLRILPILQVFCPSKGPTYIWRRLAKCSSSPFYSAGGNRGKNKSESLFFKEVSMYILYLAKLKGRSKRKGQGRVGHGEITPNSS